MNTNINLTTEFTLRREDGTKAVYCYSDLLDLYIKFNSLNARLDEIGVKESKGYDYFYQLIELAKDLLADYKNADEFNRYTMDAATRLRDKRFVAIAMDHFHVTEDVDRDELFLKVIDWLDGLDDNNLIFRPVHKSVIKNLAMIVHCRCERICHFI